MTPYTPVELEDGSLAWQDQDGELYDMTEEEQLELRMAALEQSVQQTQQDEEPEEEEGLDPWTDEWRDAVNAELSEEERRLGRPLTDKEISRYARFVEEHGEAPGRTDWKPYDLADENQRTDYMHERALEDVPEKPYSSFDEQQAEPAADNSESEAV